MILVNKRIGDRVCSCDLIGWAKIIESKWNDVRKYNKINVCVRIMKGLTDLRGNSYCYTNGYKGVMQVPINVIALTCWAVQRWFVCRTGSTPNDDITHIDHIDIFITFQKLIALGSLHNEYSTNLSLHLSLRYLQLLSISQFAEQPGLSDTFDALIVQGHSSHIDRYIIGHVR